MGPQWQSSKTDQIEQGGMLLETRNRARSSLNLKTLSLTGTE